MTKDPFGTRGFIPTTSYSEPRSKHDALRVPVNNHYFSWKVYLDVENNIGVDAANILARQTALFKGKEHQWNRRTYTRDYCNRSECGQYAYMNDGMFTGRMEPQNVGEWSAGGDCYEKVEALIIRLPYRGNHHVEEDHNHTFVAAIRVVDCDGITVDVSQTFDTVEDAYQCANNMANAECDVLREDAEKFQHEIRTEEIGEELVKIRRDVVKLIKSIKPIRCDIPSAIVMCVMDKISDMLAERRGLFRERNEMPG